MAKSKSYGGLIFLLVVVLVCAGGSWYYFNGKSDKEPEFQTTKVARGDITQVVTATGDLQPVVTVDIGAQVSGQIKEVLVDFNSVVKSGQVLAKIDEANAIQKVNQAKADLASSESSNQLLKITADRTKELFAKNLVSQSEVDNANAQLAQSDATMQTKRAALENANLDLQHCTIISPIDGMVLNRQTDVGRTVNASTNAPVLFTLVNDLTKMEINAAVAEADVGMLADNQPVKFTVDAFPNRTFKGTIRQVRNAATTNQSVVSYATIISVDNADMKLKPGMTANVSIIVSERPNVLRIANSAIRVRIPQELLPKSAAAPGAKTDKPGTPTMTDDERMRATGEIMREIGYERGTPASADQIEKAKQLAKDKGLDPDLIAARLATPGRKPGGSGKSKNGGGGGGGGGPASAGGDRGFNNTVVTRTLYKLNNPTAKEKSVEPVSVRLGISDGFTTEVLDGLSEGDTIVTGVILPGANPLLQPPGGGAQNPFQGSSHGMGMGGGRGH